MFIGKFNILVIYLIILAVISLTEYSYCASTTNRVFADLTYTIQADIVPEASLVRATMEIEYINGTDDTLDALCFRLDRNAWQRGSYMEERLIQIDDSSLTNLDDSALGYIVIDSIMNYGTPLDDEVLHYDNTALKIDLVPQLLPGEKIVLLFTFKSKLPQYKESKNKMWIFEKWYPQLCFYKDGHWFSEQYLGWNDHPVISADYNVMLTVDTSYTICHPGVLFNEKELYGLLPSFQNKIIYDNYSYTYGTDLSGEKYYPVFEDGIKKYLIKAKSVPSFPFIVTNNITRDKTISDSLKIEVCYSKTKFPWQINTAQIVLELLDSLQQILGPFPYQSLCINATDTVMLNQMGMPFITISNSIKHKEEMVATLAVNLTRCWFLPSVHNGSTDSFTEGLAYYIASQTIYDIFPESGYLNLASFEKRLKKKSSFFNLYYKDNKLKNPYIKPVEIKDLWIKNDILHLENYLYSQFRLYPSELYMLRFVVDDSILNEVISEFCKSYRYELKTKNDFIGLLNSKYANGIKEYFNQFERFGMNSDYAINAVDVIAKDGLYKTECTFDTRDCINMPIEIGYVMNIADTLFDTLQIHNFDINGNTNYYTKTLDSPPEAIVIDPHHYVSDTNRFNNYYFRRPVRYKYLEPDNLFIGFRKF